MRSSSGWGSIASSSPGASGLVLLQSSQPPFAFSGSRSSPPSCRKASTSCSSGRGSAKKRPRVGTVSPGRTSAQSPAAPGVRASPALTGYPLMRTAPAASLGSKSQHPKRALSGSCSTSNDRPEIRSRKLIRRSRGLDPGAGARSAADRASGWAATPCRDPARTLRFAVSRSRHARAGCRDGS